MAEKKVMKDTGLSIASKAVAMVLFMITDILTARLLSVGEYGEWAYFYSLITMLFWTAWFGINTSMKVHVARYAYDRKKQNSYLAASMILRMTISIIFSFLLYVFAFPLAGLAGYPDKYPNLAVLLRLGSLLLFFNSWVEFFKELFIGVAKFKNMLFIALVEFGGNLLFGLFLLWKFKTVISLETGYIISLAVLFVFSSFLFWQYFRENRELQSFSELQRYLKEIFIYAIPILFISIGSLILLELDTFMIGIFHSSEEVAVYAVAKKLCTKATHVNVAVCNATMTVFAIITKENLKDRKERFKKVMYLNTAIVAAVSLAFLAAGPFAIRLLYGAEYAQSGIVLYTLVPYYIFYAVSLFLAAFLDFQKRAKRRSLYYLSMIVLNILFNMLWIPKYGAAGAAAGTGFSMVPYFILIILETRSVFRSYDRQI